MKVQLLHKVGRVSLHGLYTDIEVICNLSVLIPLGNQLQDFSLALGEGFLPSKDPSITLSETPGLR
jgi:hypothetical protein